MKKIATVLIMGKYRGRTATAAGKLWPDIRDVALKDPGHCGYKGLTVTPGAGIEVITLSDVRP